MTDGEVAQLPELLARAMTWYRMGELDRAIEVLAELGGDPAGQYAACCLMARMIAAKAPPCGEAHPPGECTYQAAVLNPDTGRRWEWDDVGKAELFGVRFVMAMLHLDGTTAKALYFEAARDGCLAEGFWLLMTRAAESVGGSSSNGRQTVFWS